MFPGANTSHDWETDFIDGETQTIAQFLRNEACAAHTGVNLWTLSMHQGARVGPEVDRSKRNLLSRLSLWHMEHNGIFTYGARHLTLEHFVFRGRATGLATTTHALTFSGFLAGPHSSPTV